MGSVEQCAVLQPSPSTFPKSWSCPWHFSLSALCSQLLHKVMALNCRQGSFGMLCTHQTPLPLQAEQSFLVLSCSSTVPSLVAPHTWASGRTILPTFSTAWVGARLCLKTS